MRTPGHDEERALGFLQGEGPIDAPAPAGPTADLAAKVVDVEARLAFDPGRRRFYTTSSCGNGALEEIAVHAPALPAGPVVARVLLVSGRLSFELMQKAAVAGGPILVGVGAPTSLAACWPPAAR
jgi:FdhD protein